MACVKILIVVVISVCLIGCELKTNEKVELKEYELGPFTVELESEPVEQKINGVDSWVGRYIYKGEYEIDFDVGKYTARVDCSYEFLKECTQVDTLYNGNLGSYTYSEMFPLNVEGAVETLRGSVYYSPPPSKGDESYAFGLFVSVEKGRGSIEEILKIIRSVKINE